MRLIETPEQWSAIRRMPREYLGGAGAGLAYFGTPSVLMFTCDEGTPHAQQSLIWIADRATARCRTSRF